MDPVGREPSITRTRSTASAQTGGSSAARDIDRSRRSSERFRKLIAPGRDGGWQGGEEVVRAEAVSAFTLSGLCRPDRQGVTVPSRMVGPSQGAVLQTADRVLFGTGHSLGEARIQIGTGPMAGVEIRLVTGNGAVEAQLLTPTVASRQTLSLAMEEIRQRLRAKGITLRALAMPEGARARQERDPVQDRTRETP
jgi:hypothetical protein